MKLRLDEYYYIVSWEWDGIEKYMPEDMTKKFNEFCKSHNLEEIDKNIYKYLENWSIERLGLTDQAIIRISVYELIYTDTPNLVCINEAIELAKKYSDEKVAKMINGVLDKIYHEREDNE